ncbi:DUF2779 domain-containing protein [Bordetella sp. FB-8]|uniref:DUF2779 domain-containing protein n=1 Tax=Bordetella sp. FB-8 TaxID=1159870 RepID=UPI000380DED0|nr:DUF2779 domain-containing protein [Bordetella sp. FB-8]
MKALSKSKIIAYRQCPKRLWLEVHRKNLLDNSANTQKIMQAGHEVGAIAQRLYDPKGKGVLLTAQEDGYQFVYDRTREFLQSDQPIFEAGFTIGRALAFADIMLPTGRGANRGWRMVEVKSSTSVKNYHLDDAAVQAFIALESGVPLKAIALAHIDSSWVHPGGNDYAGLLIEEDVSESAFSRSDEVRTWIGESQEIVALDAEPEIRTGKHCSDPFDCGFHNYCISQEAQAEYPVQWLPGRWSQKLNSLVDDDGIKDMRDVPDDLLNTKQLRVKQVTLSGKPYFSKKETVAALVGYKFPAYFLDFETINFAVPIWKGVRPYQQVPFQFSVHRLDRKWEATHDGFLDLSGNDPSPAFVAALINSCGKSGPIFVYNAGFESGRIKELAERFPKRRQELLALVGRIVDLLPIVRDHYYHPSQQGSWSIKAVLPALCPELSYEQLDGVQDGGMAMDAYAEAIHPNVSPEKKTELESQLWKYCELDTWAMVKLWEAFNG